MRDNETLTLQEKSNLFEQILENVPAVVYINELTERGNPLSLINVWSNRFAQKLTGYSLDESRDLGFAYFEEVLHPDDLEIIKKSIDIAATSLPEMTLPFLQRVKPKGTTDYIWMYGNAVLLEKFEDGLPKKSLNVVIEISSRMFSDNQLIAALKEISRLKNKLRCQSLTSREKEVLRFIAEGLTDIEIGEKFHISFATAKTHRNNIIKKLKLKNTACLVAFAITCGLC